MDKKSLSIIVTLSIILSQLPVISYHKTSANPIFIADYSYGGLIYTNHTDRYGVKYLLTDIEMREASVHFDAVNNLQRDNKAL